VNELSWRWIALMATAVPAVGVLLAALVWRTRQIILGNLAGAAVIFGFALALILRESAEIDQVTRACLDAGCHYIDLGGLYSVNAVKIWPYCFAGNPNQHATSVKLETGWAVGPIHGRSSRATPEQGRLSRAETIGRTSGPRQTLHRSGPGSRARRVKRLPRLLRQVKRASACEPCLAQTVEQHRHVLRLAEETVVAPEQARYDIRRDALEQGRRIPP
jgi:hypothetical protein